MSSVTTDVCEADYPPDLYGETLVEEECTIPKAGGASFLTTRRI
jgi:hypothetical protein